MIGESNLVLTCGQQFLFHRITVDSTYKEGSFNPLIIIIIIYRKD